MSLTPDPNAVPHEGDEGQPAPLPPQRYESEGARDVAASAESAATPPPVPAPPAAATPAPTNLQRLEAVAGTLGFALFMICGFLFHGWAWSWLFFLLPGVLYTWNRVGKDD